MRKEACRQASFLLSELSLNLPLYTKEKSKGVQYGTYCKN